MFHVRAVKQLKEFSQHLILAQQQQQQEQQQQEQQQQQQQQKTGLIADNVRLSGATDWLVVDC